MHVPSGDAFSAAGSSDTVFARPFVATRMTTDAFAGGAPCSRAHLLISELRARIASVYAADGDGDGLGGGFGGGAATCADPDPDPPALPGDGGGGGVCLTGSGFTVGSLSGDAVMLTTEGCCG